VLAVAAGPSSAPAQRVAATELQAGASGIVASRDFWGVEIGVARRPGGQRRGAVTVALGEAGGAAAVRVSAAVQLVLTPGARTGTSPYAGVGLAFAGAEGERGAGYLAMMLGVETAPARARGWYVELGLEGGVRLAAGARWRHFSPAR
jgi:hypothetical protein